MATMYDFSVKTPDGRDVRLQEYAGKVVLVVNTASKCGFTPQYAGLEALYQRYRERGLVILGFPCNQFGHQEPGNAAEIGEFCTLNFGVTFPLFAKIEVNGRNTAPLFDFLKTAQPGVFGSQGVKWNFTKFLIDRNGCPVARYAPTTAPEKLAADIEALL